MASHKEKHESDDYKARLLVFSKRLKTEREQLGITQYALAKRAGLSGHAVISRWEAVADNKRGGEYSSAGAVARELPDVNDLINLCSVFDCEIGYLIGLQDVPKKVVADISAVTGLKPETAQSIKHINDEVKRYYRGEAQKDKQSPFYNTIAALNKLFADKEVPGLWVMHYINLFLDADNDATLGGKFDGLKEEDIALTAVLKALTDMKHNGK